MSAEEFTKNIEKYYRVPSDDFESICFSEHIPEELEAIENVYIGIASHIEDTELGRRVLPEIEAIVITWDMEKTVEDYMTPDEFSYWQKRIKTSGTPVAKIIEEGTILINPLGLLPSDIIGMLLHEIAHAETSQEENDRTGRALEGDELYKEFASNFWSEYLADRFMLLELTTHALPEPQAIRDYPSFTESQKQLKTYLTDKGQSQNSRWAVRNLTYMLGHGYARISQDLDSEQSPYKDFTESISDPNVRQTIEALGTAADQLWTNGQRCCTTETVNELYPYIGNIVESLEATSMDN